MAVNEHMAESALSIKLWRSLFLVKCQGFPINDSKRACDRVCEGVCF